MVRTLADVRRLVDDRGIKFFLCSYVEMSGAPKAKLVPATNLEEMAEEGAGFAGFAAGEIGQGPHDPDMACIPDFGSLQIVPWRPEIAWVAGNIHVNEQEWPYCPRTILQRQLDKVRQQGYTFNTGTEAEFMLLKQGEHGAYAPWDTLDTLGKPCYDLRALHRNLDIITTIVTYMQELGWGPYAADHEDATCQFELNWLYGAGATTPDRHTFFKWMVKTVAEQHGLLATFMPKPFAHLTGNGAHHHISLWDAENKTNLFEDESDANGLSQLAYWFMGGVLHHAPALAAVTCPIVNSYKRLIRGAPRSGATWAPRLRHLWRLQPHADDPHSRPRAGSRTASWTAQPTPTSPVPPCSPPGWTASSASLTPAPATTTTSTKCPRTSYAPAASASSPPTSATP